MLIGEILDSVEAVRDPYLRAVTYAKMGELLFKAKKKEFKVAFTRAVETAQAIEDPLKMFRAIMATGYYLGRAGIKAYRKVFQNVISDTEEIEGRDVILRMGVPYLVALGDYEMALTYASLISDETTADVSRLVIIRGIRKKTEEGSEELLEWAFSAFEGIKNEPWRSRAAVDLVKINLLAGNYTGAISTIIEINDGEWADYAFKQVVFTLKEKKILENYLHDLWRVAETLSKAFGPGLLHSLALAFALIGEGDAAVELLRRAGAPLDVFVSIANDLFDRDPSVLPAFIEALSGDEAVAVGKAVMNRILDNPDIEHLKIVTAIGQSTENEAVWTKIARYYVLTGDFDDAIKVAFYIKDKKLRSLILADVAHNFVKMGWVSKAIDLALEVQDEKYSPLVVSEVLIKALEFELRREE